MYLLRADDRSLWSTGSNPTRPSTQQSPIPGKRKRPTGSLSTYLSRAQLWFPAAPPHLPTATCAEGSSMSGVGRGQAGEGKEARTGEGPGLGGVKCIAYPLCFLAHSGPSTQQVLNERLRNKPRHGQLGRAQVELCPELAGGPRWGVSPSPLSVSHLLWEMGARGEAARWPAPPV